jgi:hypothetical protein
MPISPYLRGEASPIPARSSGEHDDDLDNIFARVTQAKGPRTKKPPVLRGGLGGGVQRLLRRSIDVVAKLLS